MLAFALILSVLTSVFTLYAESGVSFYVSENGSDDGDGSESSPFKTIARARDAVRELKNTQGLPEGGVTVFVGQGIYRLDSALQFAQEDSGTDTAPVTYRAKPGERVILSGSKLLEKESFRPVSDAEKELFRRKGGDSHAAVDRLLVCDLTEYGFTSFNDIYGSGFVNELLVNGQRQTVAQYPNKGEFVTLTGLNGLTATIAESDTVFGTWTLRNNEWIVGYIGNDWSFSTLELLGLNGESNTFTMEDGSGYGYNNGAKIYFVNIPEELDCPGEYYIDRTSGKLFYYPEDDFSSSEIEISVNGSELLSIKADNIIIDGFCFNGGNRGISVNGNDVTVKNCVFTGLYDTAVSVRGYRNTVTNNNIYNIGGVGVAVSGGDDKALTPSRTRITNNVIHDYASVYKTYYPGVVASGTGIYIAHNEIYNAPHEGIEYNGAEIVIEYNEIYNVCNETGDAGAVYAGRRWDWDSCIIRYNYIHDLGTAGMGKPNAIYWDDALAGQTAYGNIVCDVLGNGFLIGGGRDNKVINNIVINCGTYLIQYDARATKGNWASGLSVYSTSGMWKELKLRPYRSLLWQNKFPILALLKDSSSNETDDFDSGANNAYSVVKNNVFAEHSVMYSLSYPFAVLSTARDNRFYPDRNDIGFRNIGEGDMALSGDSRVFYEIENFEQIPFAEIGVIGSVPENM